MFPSRSGLIVSTYCFVVKRDDPTLTCARLQEAALSLARAPALCLRLASFQKQSGVSENRDAAQIEFHSALSITAFLRRLRQRASESRVRPDRDSIRLPRLRDLRRHQYAEG